MNHSLFTANTSLSLVASLSCASYLCDELAIWWIYGFKKQTKNTYSFCVVFPFLPNQVKPPFPEVCKGFSTALYKTLRILYFSFLEKNVHGRIQASFKWSSRAWHQVAPWVQIIVIIWRQQLLHQWNFWNGKFLRPNPGLVYVATLKQDLSSMQEWRMVHEVLWICRSGKVAEPTHMYLVSCPE